MNPFAVLRQIQDSYKTYVRSFQRFNNPAPTGHMNNGLMTMINDAEKQFALR